jgi:beta-glucosidase
LFVCPAGEDPYLGYAMVQPVITGIQSMGVIANAKHFILNSQETNRNSQTAIIDERTFFEMYMPPFQGAVDADVGSIMVSGSSPAFACALLPVPSARDACAFVPAQPLLFAAAS